jgi:hypothetical protein
MFVQVIEGSVTDPERFNRQVERWDAELRPGAAGYLGTTWGLDGDGHAVVAACFESREGAETNSARSEQGAWWAETAEVFGDVEFADCDEVDTFLGGVSPDAGFVQVIEGAAADRSAARALFREADDRLAAGRPDILGGLVAWHGDGNDFTQVVYFRSESDARSGEASEDEDLDRRYREMIAGDPRFIDLTEPRIVVSG